MAEPAEDLSYDDAFAELEKVLAALESGELPLDEALTLYERGAALARVCARKLDEAELRVRQWQNGQQVAPVADWQES
jgi:exodeoxyribonuclease VII small subunit